jgi:hypothetical protein
MTEREAKRLACFWTREVLRSDLSSAFIIFDDDGGDRSEDDIRRLENAFEELELEMTRRSGER